MRFVEEEHQLGLVRIADLGQLLEQLRQHPQEEGRIQPRRVHQLVGRQHVHQPVPAGVCLHEVLDVEHRLAEELLAALGLDLQQATLDDADAGGADVAVLGGEAAGVVADMLQHCAQVLQVQQQQALVVGHLEHQVQHAGLGFVEVQHPPQQQRTHIRDRRPHRVALFAEHVPQRDRAGRGLRHRQAALLDHRGQLAFELAGLTDTGQVALDVGHEHRHADARKVLGHGLQCHGLAGAGGAGDQAMAVRQLRQQQGFGLAVAGDEERFGHQGLPQGKK